MSALAKIYGKHVLSGKKTIDEVPETIKEEVREYVLSIDPNFFDVPEEPTVETPEENPTEGKYTPVDTSGETITE